MRLILLCHISALYRSVCYCLIFMYLYHIRVLVLAVSLSVNQKKKLLFSLIDMNYYCVVLLISVQMHIAG
jgi:hypothetical protein